MAADSERITIVGAGLVGSLLSLFLARRGFASEIIERRPDMRLEAISAGRSINLAISLRGLHALEQVGLKEDILSRAVPMKGRMIHMRDGGLRFQPYGKDPSQCINSISRGTLNKVLMTHAEATGKVKIRFSERATDMDFKHGITFGADGSFSAVRAAMVACGAAREQVSQLDSGYKELMIPPGPGGSFLIEEHAVLRPPGGLGFALFGGRSLSHKCGESRGRVNGSKGLLEELFSLLVEKLIYGKLRS